MSSVADFKELSVFLDFQLLLNYFFCRLIQDYFRQFSVFFQDGAAVLLEDSFSFNTVFCTSLYFMFILVEINWFE